MTNFSNRPRRRIEKIRQKSGQDFFAKIERAKKRLIKISEDAENGGLKEGFPKVLTSENIKRHFDKAAEIVADPKELEKIPKIRKAIVGNREPEISATAIIGDSEEDVLPGISEAIIELVETETRPPLFMVEDRIILDGRYGIENDYEDNDLITSNLNLLEERSKLVGAVDLLNHKTKDYVGTGWMIDNDIVVTNRHVAKEFLDPVGFGSWTKKHVIGQANAQEELGVALNFYRQQDTSTRKQVLIKELLYMARDGEPDMAFFRCSKRSDSYLEPESKKDFLDLSVGVVGYPAWDGQRNDMDGIMGSTFGYKYSVKRFSPGEIDAIKDGYLIEHDCTTLGGNSGSPLLNLNTGKVVGLHFSGRYGEANQAVHADIVWSALKQIKGVQVQGAQVEVVKKPVRSKQYLSRRRGYNPKFLGKDSLQVPLPSLGKHKGDISKLTRGRGSELKYHHFSVLQSRSRKLPRLTAVNIHGRRLGKVPESNSWHFDPRIALDDQSGNELYKDTGIDNPLDRGHMVRRLDPCWGTKADIKKAQRDTYHYTNSAPQHLGLNRRHWVGLEDYILDAALALDMKVSVFTGPVFRDDDPQLVSGASGVAIPREYWKVAALVNKTTGALSASAYILSQGHMLRGFTESAFVFGQYETYQVPISLIEKETGYDFGVLADADVMSQVSETESRFPKVFKRIVGPMQVSLT